MKTFPTPEQEFELFLRMVYRGVLLSRDETRQLKMAFSAGLAVTQMAFETASTYDEDTAIGILAKFKKEIEAMMAEFFPAGYNAIKPQHN